MKRTLPILTLLVCCVIPAPLLAAITIHDIRLIEYRIDRTKKFVTAKGSSDACYGIFVLLEAKADNGSRPISALGDILPRTTVTNETSKDAWAAAQLFKVALSGKQIGGTDLKQDAQTVRELMKELTALAAKQKLTTKKPPPPDRQLRATLCGFDEALLDLVGQAHKVPIYEVLGGKKRDAVVVAAPTFNADESAASLAGKVEEADESFQAMRIKIGMDDDEDVKRIVAVATELQKKRMSSPEIWVDVNQAWKTSEKSIAMLQRIRDALGEARFVGRFICEQPTIDTDIPALADVTRQTREWRTLGRNPVQIVICADECVWTLDDAKKMVELDAADVVNIKIQKAGGLLNSIDIGNYLAESKPDIEIYVGGVVATDVTSWANLQLCFALPKLEYATGCVPRRAYPVNIATDPIRYENERTKALWPPTRSGLGTALDLSKLEKYIKHDSEHPTTGEKD